MNSKIIHFCIDFITKIDQISAMLSSCSENNFLEISILMNKLQQRSIGNKVQELSHSGVSTHVSWYLPVYFRRLRLQETTNVEDSLHLWCGVFEEVCSEGERKGLRARKRLLQMPVSRYVVWNRVQELSEPFWCCPKPFRYPDSAGMKKRAEHTESDEPGSYLTKLRHTEGPSLAELWSEDGWTGR